MTAPPLAPILPAESPSELSPVVVGAVVAGQWRTVGRDDPGRGLRR